MPGVTVRLLGVLGARRDSSVEVETGLGSRKARRLLARLAVADGHVVPLDVLVEALWPDAVPRRPADNVATLASRLRSLLGSAAIVGGRGGYALGPAVTVDLREAARLVTDAREHGTPAPARAALELLGTGVVLSGEDDAAWVAAARAEGERLLRGARHALAAAALRADDPATAVDAARAAAETDRLDEEAHRLWMTALAAMGEPAQALTVYGALRTALAEELGVDPSPATRELYMTVLRDPPAPVRAPAPTGRSREIAALTRAWTAAAGGRAGFVLLAGEAGIGKTTLAAALVDHARSSGALVLAARCYAAERSLFLQPLVEAMEPALADRSADELRALAGGHGPDVAGLFPALPALGPANTERASPETEQRRAFTALAHVLRGLAATGPVLLVLDDLHNAGLTTVELLHHLARRVTGRRVLMLATVRAEEGEAALATLQDVADRLDVGPLDAAAVTALAEAAGRTDLGAAILRRTRGHTLFVVETLRGLLAGDDAVPDTLQAAVLARLRRAGDEAAELLRAGAVLGATVDPAVVGAMLDVAEPVALRRCERAAAARLLTVAGRRYEFVNDLVQEVLYATTPEPVRVAHHRRAADLLTRSPEAVARHALAAGDPARAARAFLLAGEQALARHAVADAEALFTRAVQLAEEPELVARARLARGQAREGLGTFADAEADQHAALAAARAAGDRRTEMMALRALGGHASLARGVPIEVCTARLRRGLEIAESLGDREAEAVLQSWLAIVATNRLRFAEGLDRARRAVRAGRAAGTDRARAVALDAQKNAHAYLGELGPMAAVLDELDPLLRRLGDLELLSWAVFESAFAAIATGEWARAQMLVEEALAINERSGHPVHAPWFVAHLGWIARTRGRIDEAVEQGRNAVALAEPMAHRWFLPLAETWLAATLMAGGHRAEAAGLLFAARGRLGDAGPEAHRLRCLATLAEVSGDRAVLDEAQALLAAIDAPPGGAWLPGADAYLAIARAWLAHGEPDRARAALAPLGAAAATQGWTTVVTQVVDVARPLPAGTGVALLPSGDSKATPLPAGGGDGASDQGG